MSQYINMFMLMFGQEGEVILEDKHVQNQLINIKDTSPLANADKDIILATPTLHSNFTKTVEHLSTTLQLGQSLTVRS